MTTDLRPEQRMRPRLRVMLEAVLTCTARRNAKGLSLEVGVAELADVTELKSMSCLDAAAKLSELGLVQRRGERFRLTEPGLVALRRMQDEKAARR